MSFEVAAMSFGYCEGEDPAQTAPRKKENFFVFVVGTLSGIDIETVRQRVEWYKSTYNDHQTIEVSENGGAVSFFIRSWKFYDLWFGERNMTFFTLFSKGLGIVSGSPIALTWYIVLGFPQLVFTYGISKLYEVRTNWQLHRAVENTSIISLSSFQRRMPI